MNRQRILILLGLILVLAGVSALYVARTWHDATTRFRTGLPIPRNLLQNNGLLNSADVVPTGPPTLPAIRASDPALNGSASSTLVIVAFGDFQCEFCRTQARALEDALVAIGKDSSRVGVIWRDLPLVNQHERAMSAAVAAQCAARQGRFRQMHDALFFQAQDLSDAELLGFAELLRLNKEQYLTCLRDPAITFRLQRDLEDARTHGITAVPMLFVNGTPIDGLVDSETLVAIMNRELSIAP